MIFPGLESMLKVVQKPIVQNNFLKGRRSKDAMIILLYNPSRYIFSSSIHYCILKRKEKAERHAVACTLPFVTEYCESYTNQAPGFDFLFGKQKKRFQNF